jgi:hypothetical protein
MTGHYFLNRSPFGGNGKQKHTATTLEIIFKFANIIYQIQGV